MAYTEYRLRWRRGDRSWQRRTFSQMPSLTRTATKLKKADPRTELRLDTRPVGKWEEQSTPYWMTKL